MECSRDEESEETEEEPIKVEEIKVDGPLETEKDERKARLSAE